MIDIVSHIEHPLLKEAIRTLVPAIQPVKIICFGFHSSSGQAWSCFHPDTHREKFHYELLIVRKEKDSRNEAAIFQLIDKACSETLSLNAISHSEFAVQKALARSNPFFTTLFNEGATLYTSEEAGEQEFKTGSPSIKRIDETKRSTEWARWFELSERFLSSSSLALDNGWHDLGVFQLHQAVEHGSIALLRALIGYRPSCHCITKLLALVRVIEPKVAEIFPCNTKDEVELFSYLRKSYSDVRYKEKYHIPAHIAFTLLERVSEFRDLIEERYNRELPAVNCLLPLSGAEVPSVPL